MTLPSPEDCRLIRQVHALLGSSLPNESATAHQTLIKLLAKHGLTWNDLPAVLAATEDLTGITFTDVGKSTSTSTAEPHKPPAVNVLDLVLFLIERHVAITAEERMAAALWVLHSYVFDRFMITPRLVLVSPVRGCGKTTLLELLELLVAEPYRTDNVTAAAIYHLLDRFRFTLLIDEGDNLDLLRNSVLRSVFNSGHRRGGTIGRFVGGRSRRFPTFAPLALAAIGGLPLPLLHRSVVINMRRHAPGEAQVRRLDETDPSFPAAREEIKKWAATCSLARDPIMPPTLRNRAADNWRVLLAIADDLGHDEDARSASIVLCANQPDEDPGVVLLADIRTVFLARGVDRITSLALVEALVGLDYGLWNEWRGPHDDRPPHKLTQGELAQLLSRFNIRPRTIWPLHRRPGDTSGRGYMRHQFEAPWRAYCPSDTPTHPGSIRYLRQS
jgi:hypothetical protein